LVLPLWGSTGGVLCGVEEHRGGERKT